MKTMTCKELGGECDLEFREDTFDEIHQMSQIHGKEMFQKGRYLVGELPVLPVASGSFGLAVCTHLLFLYSDLLTEDFPIRAARELCGVARVVRNFPLLKLSRTPSPHLAAVRSALAAEGWRSETVHVEYELQRGGNQMLRLFRA